MISGSRILLSLLGLLTFTSVAHAECAWVLWIQQSLGLSI